MTDDRWIERAARSWLEAGPTQAPEGAVEAALVRIESTPQERDLRVPWRLPKMITPARFAAAALVGVLAVGSVFLVLGGRGQPAVGAHGTTRPASPSPSTSVVPPLSETHTSALAGYTMNYPKGWTVTPAMKPWTAGYETRMFSDRISGDHSAFYGTSMKLPPGTSFETWFAAYDADRTSNTPCAAGSLNEEITIDGAEGRLDVHCMTHYLEAVVPKGDRVYVFTMFVPLTRALFESLLDTTRLTPETARD